MADLLGKELVRNIKTGLRRAEVRTKRGNGQRNLKAPALTRTHTFIIKGELRKKGLLDIRAERMWIPTSFCETLGVRLTGLSD